MTVIEYCRHETRVYELVIIRAGGRVSCSAYIDHEDLFRLPLDIAEAEVIRSKRGYIDIATRAGGAWSAPCVYLDIK